MQMMPNKALQATLSTHTVASAPELCRYRAEQSLASLAG
jgi:hypothetical protein